MANIFTAEPSDLNSLSPDEAVAFFREMLWSEASSSGIAKNLLNVPGAITVADGGVDAEAADVDRDSAQGLIRKGLTRYQIKTGDFCITRRSAIRSILLSEKMGELKPRIKSCLDRRGTLVVVLFGWDDPEHKEGEIKSKFRAELAPLGYATANVEICGQSRICSYLRPFPSLALKLTRRDNAAFQSHRSWSLQDDMRTSYILDESRKGFLETMKSDLRNPSQSVHIRILGEPGIGKTRLVLEATREPDLEPLILYCDSATSFKDSVLMNEILRDDNRFEAILVLDDCDDETSSYVWNKMKNLGKRIKIISIGDDFGITTGSVRTLVAPRLSENSISKLIQSYGIQPNQARLWSSLCGGSPRVALVIGLNLRSNSEDLLRPPDTSNVWDRYIIGGDDRNNKIVLQRTVVLRQIALFAKFGFSAKTIDEAKWISYLSGEVDPEITWPRCQEIIHELKTRRIVQGEKTLFITPRALHIKLWADWWNNYGMDFELEYFTKGMPPFLLQGFYEMLRYARTSANCERVVRSILGEDGLFCDGKELGTVNGSMLFAALAEADPESALNCLRRTIATWPEDKLKQLGTARGEVVDALRGMAIWKALFLDAARVLRVLAHVETGWDENNATGAFVSLFSLIPGYAAPTEMAPGERYSILVETWNLNSIAYKKLALEAVDKALEVNRMVRLPYSRPQGLHRDPELWMPKSRDEHMREYLRLWEFIDQHLGDPDINEELVQAVLRHLINLGTLETTTEPVCSTVERIVEQGWVNTSTGLPVVLTFLEYKGNGLPESIRKRYESIRYKLEGTTFDSLLRRYVGFTLIGDYDARSGELREEIKARLADLASQAIKNVPAFESEIDWLMGPEAKNAFEFGLQIGLNDISLDLLDILLRAQSKKPDHPNLAFLGGYFKAMSKHNPKRLNDTLDSLASNIETVGWLPDLTWSSGLSDSGLTRIMNLLEKSHLDATNLNIFRFGNPLQAVSEQAFLGLVDSLLKMRKAKAFSLLLGFFCSYYVRRNDKVLLDQELAMRILSEALSLDVSDGGDQMDAYYWVEIAKALITDYPERRIDMLTMIVKSFGADDSILGGQMNQVKQLLHDIVASSPRDAWKVVSQYLGPPMDKRAFYLGRWLRGEASDSVEEPPPPLSLMPIEDIVSWVEEDVEKRAKYLASLAPPIIDKSKIEAGVARSLLSIHGERADVREALASNFSTEFISGSIDEHLRGKVTELTKVLEQEEDHKIAAWIRFYLGRVEEAIGQSLEDEERLDLW